MKKLQQTSILVHIWNQIANFEVKFTWKLLILNKMAVVTKNFTMYSNVKLFDFYSSD